MESPASPAPKGRPREFDPDAALVAALRVFWRRGYEGASLSELTEAMGITKPSLYAAFGNKESLFKKALDLYECEKMSYVADALAAPTARAVAERLLRGAIKLTASGSDPRGCLGVISAVSCTAENEAIKEEVAKRRASSSKALTDRFVRAKAEGDLPEGVEPATLSRYLSVVMQGMSVQAQAGAAPEELERIVDLTLATWPGR